MYNITKRKETDARIQKHWAETWKKYVWTIFINSLRKLVPPLTARFPVKNAPYFGRLYIF